MRGLCELTRIPSKIGVACLKNSRPLISVTPTAALNINGKAIAGEITKEIKISTESFKLKSGVTPGITTVLVGSHPASKTYVDKKILTAKDCGFNGHVNHLPGDISQSQLIDVITKLDNDPSVHAILVQLPLPDHIDTTHVLSHISPGKDVDGVGAYNLGNLVISQDRPHAIPCTPLGCLELLKRSNVEIQGKNVVIVGRSKLVGIPLAQLLIQHDATVTVCHSKSKNLKEITRTADILVTAIGRPEMVKGDWIKPGATVIDVGINHIPDLRNPPKTRIVGDVAYDEAKMVASLITPVPGGVGPMTIAMLMHNTLALARGHVARQ
jgi:methylenetetrahydrofolate dehydrogenase (NADP+)/methenyltetrahydrofolate cyclohydrolase